MNRSGKKPSITTENGLKQQLSSPNASSSMLSRATRGKKPSGLAKVRGRLPPWLPVLKADWTANHIVTIVIMTKGTLPALAKTTEAAVRGSRS